MRSVHRLTWSELREQLLAAQAAQVAGQPPHLQINTQTEEEATSPPPDIAPPEQLDSSMAEGGYGMDDMDMDGDQEIGPDGKRGAKRELSSSKRAAQNRAAQVSNLRRRAVNRNSDD